MINFISRTLGLNQDNFSINIYSSRISKRRLNIQWKINKLKRSFRIRKNKYFKNLDNKDEVDLITREPVNQISIHNLLVLNIDNKQLGISASNLLRWIDTYEWDEIPKNPFTNIPLRKFERNKCLLISKKFWLSNLNLKHLEDENISLKNTIRSLKQKETYRQNPKLQIDIFLSIIFSLKFELSTLLEISYLEDILYFDLQNFDDWCHPNTEHHIILRVKSIGYMLEALEFQIQEIEDKITSNFFI